MRELVFKDNPYDVLKEALDIPDLKNVVVILDAEAREVMISHNNADWEFLSLASNFIELESTRKLALAVKAMRHSTEKPL